MSMDLSKGITAVVSVIILIIIVFTIVGTTATDMTTAANNVTGCRYGVNDTQDCSLPLSGLFSGSGVLFLILMVGIFLGMMTAIFKIKG